MLNLKRKKSFTVSNRNSLSKLKHEDLYPWETTVRVEDSIINDITGERIREINLLKYAILQDLQWQIWNIILFQKSSRNLVTLFYASGQMMLTIPNSLRQTFKVETSSDK